MDRSTHTAVTCCFLTERGQDRDKYLNDPILDICLEETSRLYRFSLRCMQRFVRHSALVSDDDDDDDDDDYYYYYYYYYKFALTKLNLPLLCTQRHHLDALFFIQTYRGLKSCLSFLEMVYLHVAPRHVRDFSAFSVFPSNKHCPSSRCANAANVVGKFLDIFTVRTVSLHLMQQLVLT
jgi:hypothetical protein